jgi:pyruvate/2-oxoglutarate dehydrogenase complex dihydrolipoamide dehydrogenase (E3) component
MQDPTEISYDNVASIMFLKPEVACVGMNELEARRQRIPHKVTCRVQHVWRRLPWAIIANPSPQPIFRLAAGRRRGL